MSTRPEILCLSHLRWGFAFQRPNHLMALAARNRRVFFAEEPIYGASTAELEVREESPNLFVIVPRLPNDVPVRNHALLAQLLSDFALARSIVDPVAWFCTPMALEFARGIHASLTVYDCMDDLSALHGAPPAMSILESELFERADLVFTGGHGLYLAKRDLHPNIHSFPSGVDLQATWDEMAALVDNEHERKLQRYSGVRNVAPALRTLRDELSHAARSSPLTAR